MTEDKIIPKYIGESIERSKRRKEKLDEIIFEFKRLTPQPPWSEIAYLIEKLEKFKEEEL